MGRPPIEDQFAEIPNRRVRWAKRNPEKVKQSQKRYYEKKKHTATSHAISKDI